MKKLLIILITLLFWGCGDTSTGSTDPGQNGGDCYENSTCDLGLTCNTSTKCEKVKEGTPDGFCFGNGTCLENYLCDSEKKHLHRSL